MKLSIQGFSCTHGNNATLVWVLVRCWVCIRPFLRQWWLSIIGDDGNGDDDAVGMAMAMMMMVMIMMMMMVMMMMTMTMMMKTTMEIMLLPMMILVTIMFILEGSFLCYAYFVIRNFFVLVVGPNCVDYRPYTGNQSTSQAGNACQSWTARGFVDNHIHGSNVVDAQNFCRHMGSNSAYQQPVCITSSGMEKCDVPKCPRKCNNLMCQCYLSHW